MEPKEPIINFEALLAPIAEENPSGEYQRYSGIYDEISEARRADLDVPQGEWQTDMKVADHRKVVALAVPVLENTTKDLQIAAWLVEALVKIHGFTGLRDGIRLLTGLQDKFWPSIHPEIDEGDMEGRANAVAWVEQQLALAVRLVPITGHYGYSFNDHEDSKRFDFPDNVELLDTAEQERIAEQRAQAERENRVTANKWRAELAGTSRAFCEELNFLIGECWDAMRDLNRSIEEHYDRNQAPSLTIVNKALDDVQTLVNKILAEKRAEEPDEVTAIEEDGGGDGEGVVRTSGPAVATGAIQNRQDALKRLSDIADFFRRTEPHSPISYIVTRAVKWGNMPLEVWLQDVVKDETVIYQLRQTLGLNTGLTGNDE